MVVLGVGQAFPSHRVAFSVLDAFPLHRRIRTEDAALGRRPAGVAA